MEYIVNIITLSLILFSIWKWQASTIVSKTGYLMIVLLKCFFAIFSCYYYKFGDIALFQKDSEALTSIIFTEFDLYKDIVLNDDYSIRDVRGWFYYWPKPRAFFMAKILSLLNVITLNNIYINAVYFAFFNLFAGFVLLNKVKFFFKEYLLASVLALLFIPSIIFNTAGLEKEVLVMGGVYLVFAFGISIFKKHFTFIDVVYLIVGLFLIYKIKYYYVAVILPLGLAFLLSSLIGNKLVKFTLSIIVVLFSIFLTKYIHSYLEPKMILFSLVEANNKLMLGSEKGMFIPFQFSNYSFSEILFNAPMALINGLFGPFLWQAKNSAMFVIGVENLAVLLLSLWFIAKVIRKEIKWTYFGSIVLIYIVSLSILLAFYSPNYGTLTRYKVIFMPFLYLFVIRFTIDKYLKDSPIIKLILK